LDERARAAVKDAGFLAGAAILGLTAARRGDPFALPRLAVNPGDSRLELLLKASGAYPWLSRLPRVGLLRVLRRRPAVLRSPAETGRGAGDSSR
jgi:hypothetical protein